MRKVARSKSRADGVAKLVDNRSNSCLGFYLFLRSSKLRYLAVSRLGAILKTHEFSRYRFSVPRGLKFFQQPPSRIPEPRARESRPIKDHRRVLDVLCQYTRS